MEKITIIPKFYTKAQASKQATIQRQLLKSNGSTKTHKLEILFAYNFWRTNKWFNQKKFGLSNPTDQDYIIIITEISKPKTIIMASTKQDQTPKAPNSKLHSAKLKKIIIKKTQSTKTPAITSPFPISTKRAFDNYILLTIHSPFIYRSVA